MVVGISDVEEVTTRHSDPERMVELSTGSGATITAEPGSASSCDGGDDPVPIDAADPMIVRVGEVEIPSRIKCNPVGVVELGSNGRPTVPAEATGTSARDHRQRPILVHAEDPARASAESLSGDGWIRRAFGYKQGAGGSAR